MKRLSRTALASALLLASACDSPSSGGAAAATSASAHADVPAASATASPAKTAPSADQAKAGPPNVAAEYRGTIGTAAVVARLRVDGVKVTGSYFYENVGAEIMLTGSMSAAQLTLDETTDKAKTGALTLDVAADGALSGTWTDAKKEKSAPVKLEAIGIAPKPAKALVFKRTSHATKPVKDKKGPKDVCKADIAYAEVYGLPSTIEAKMNLDLAPAAELKLDACEHVVNVGADYRVAYNDNGLLSIRVTSFIQDSEAAMASSRGGRVLTVVLATGAPVKLMGDIVKPKAERTFESAMNQQIVIAAKKNNLDEDGRKQLDAALAFSPPFVIETTGVRLYPDSLPAPFAVFADEGILVRYATLPRPNGPAAVLWGK